MLSQTLRTIYKFLVTNNSLNQQGLKRTQLLNHQQLTKLSVSHLKAAVFVVEEGVDNPVL